MLEIEYDDSALLESLVEDIREFTDGMEASEGKGEYSIRKVRDSIRHSHLLRADLRGHCLELTVNEWPVHMFLREGILQVGWDEIHLQTSDMAFAALNYLEGILPEYVSRFRARSIMVWSISGRARFSSSRKRMTGLPSTGNQ